MEIEEKLNTPLVSIVVVTYNSSKYVLETLESAKAQTYQNIELIVTDDCSSDDTVAVCEKWIKENKERFVRTELITVTENTGIPGNCNRGVKAAQGEWVKIIAGDDALLKEMLETLMNCVKKNEKENIEIIHGEMNVFNTTFQTENFVKRTDFSTLKQHKLDISAKEQYEIFLRRGYINAPAMIICKSVFEKVGLFDEAYTLYEDTPFLLKCIKDGIKLHYINIPLVNYRKSVNSVQIKKAKKLQLITDYQLQKDKHTLNYMVPNLPLNERLFLIYLIKFRVLFVHLGLNYSLFVNKVILFIFTSFFEKKINQLNKKIIS